MRFSKTSFYLFINECDIGRLIESQEKIVQSVFLMKNKIQEHKRIKILLFEIKNRKR